MLGYKAAKAAATAKLKEEEGSISNCQPLRENKGGRSAFEDELLNDASYFHGSRGCIFGATELFPISSSYCTIPVSDLTSNQWITYVLLFYRGRRQLRSPILCVILPTCWLGARQTKMPIEEAIVIVQLHGQRYVLYMMAVADKVFFYSSELWLPRHLMPRLWLIFFMFD